MGHSKYDPAAKQRRRGTRGEWSAPNVHLKPQQVWAIRFWLDHERRLRDRAMFNLAIDSSPRECDTVKVRIGDLVSGGHVRVRAIVTQQKTGRPVQFELLEPARGSILAWLERRGGTTDDSRFRAGLITPIISALGNIRVGDWNRIAPEDYGTHPLRRIKASIIYPGFWAISTMSNETDHGEASRCTQQIHRSRAIWLVCLDPSHVRHPLFQGGLPDPEAATATQRGTSWLKERRF